jgi:protein gp37
MLSLNYKSNKKNDMSKIEWTDQTWNPIIVPCTKISTGCDNCYAETMAKRLSKIESTKYYEKVVNENGWCGTPYFVKSQLEKPLKRKKPTKYFVCSMGDLFHESIPYVWFERVMSVISKCPQHTFQILTKRPEIMAWYFNAFYKSQPGLLNNVWLGVTAENQEQANIRIPVLLQIPAKVRFVSVEPMLSAIDLTSLSQTDILNTNALNGQSYILGETYENVNDLILDWVICGGETGHNARPMHPEWVRSLRDQCKEVDVPFFFKGWGEWWPADPQRLYRKQPEVINNQLVFRTGNKNSGCMIEGEKFKQFPKT